MPKFRISQSVTLGRDIVVEADTLEKAKEVADPNLQDVSGFFCVEGEGWDCVAFEQAEEQI